MAPFLPVNDRRQYGKINKHRAIEKRYYIIQWCMHVDMMFMFISWYWLRFHEYELILWKYDQIIFKFNFESHYIHIRICIYIHDFLWWYCHEHNTLYIILYVLYIVTTFLPGHTTSALHYWTKGLLPCEAWYIQTSLGQHVNEAIIGTLEGWKVAIMELGTTNLSN